MIVIPQIYEFFSLPHAVFWHYMPYSKLELLVIIDYLRNFAVVTTNQSKNAHFCIYTCRAGRSYRY